MRCHTRAPRGFASAHTLRQHRGQHRRVIARDKNADSAAAPYANGLLEVAKENGNADNIYNDLMRLQGLLAPPPPPKDGSEPAKNELREFLMNPLQSESRKEVVDTMGKEYSLQEASLNLLKVLIDNNRLECIQEIAERYERAYNENSETKVVTLYSATRLGSEQEFQIAKQLQEVTESKNIKIKPVIDESLLGGFIVEYGDNRMDLSVRGHLDKIALELDGNFIASELNAASSDPV